MNRHQQYVEQRAIEAANYILSTKATVREAAKHFGISKSNLHIDVTRRLSDINPQLASHVHEVLEFNKDQRSIRGGLATHNKYLKH